MADGRQSNESDQVKQAFLDKGVLIWQSDKDDGGIVSDSSSSKKPSRVPLAWFDKLNQSRDKIIEVNQVHGSQVVEVDKGNVGRFSGGKIPVGDGMITSLVGVPLMLKTADCMPVVIYDPVNKVVLLVHVGWRGAVAKIFVTGLMLMMQKYKTEARSVKVWLGPSIRKCCYQFGEEPVQSQLPEWSGFVDMKKGKWSIDLAGYVTNTLIEVGVAKTSIISDGGCTYHEDKKWFSYLRHKRTKEKGGLMGTVVWLV